MLSNTIVKALSGTYILEYRKNLCLAIFTVGESHPTTDAGFYQGMEHALYLLDEMYRQELEKAISNASIAKYRKILLEAIDAHSAMINQTEYDHAFRQGMKNALSILDDFCDKEFKKACIEAINKEYKEFGGLNK